MEFSKWKTEYNKSSDIQNNYIIVYDKHIFLVSNYFVNEKKDFDAIGAGESFALAALYLNHSPEEAIIIFTINLKD